MKYKEIPCECGFTYLYEPSEFEIFQMKMGKLFGQKLSDRPTLRCKTCKKVSIVARSEDEMD
jgi:hypothetical protein